MEPPSLVAPLFVVVFPPSLAVPPVLPSSPALAESPPDAPLVVPPTFSEAEPALAPAPALPPGVSPELEHPAVARVVSKIISPPPRLPRVIVRMSPPRFSRVYQERSWLSARRWCRGSTELRAETLIENENDFHFQ
jgi:hypothetical protein